MRAALSCWAYVSAEVRSRKPSALVALGVASAAVLILLWKATSLAVLLVGANGKPAVTQHIPGPRPPRGAGVHFDYGEYCDMLYNAGGWNGLSHVSSCDESTAPGAATCGPGHNNTWQWSDAAMKCGSRRFDAAGASALLKDKWVVFAGDSVGRSLYAALLRLVSTDRQQQIVYGHQDFEYTLPGNIRASFMWTPYTQNITAMLLQWRVSGLQPSSAILGAGLWHMLHVTDAGHFGRGLAWLRSAAMQLLEHQEANAESGREATQLYWYSISELAPEKLKAPDKRATMTDAAVDSYNQASMNSQMLLPDGPFLLLDLHRLTQGCGESCTADGIHYQNMVYDAALQIWLNILRIS